MGGEDKRRKGGGEEGRRGGAVRFRGRGGAGRGCVPVGRAMEASARNWGDGGVRGCGGPLAGASAVRECVSG